MLYNVLGMKAMSNISVLKNKITDILDEVGHNGRYEPEDVNKIMEIIAYQVFGSVMSKDFFSSWVNYAESNDDH